MKEPKIKYLLGGHVVLSHENLIYPCATRFEAVVRGAALVRQAQDQQVEEDVVEEALARLKGLR